MKRYCLNHDVKRYVHRMKKYVRPERHINTTKSEISWTLALTFPFAPGLLRDEKGEILRFETREKACQFVKDGGAGENTFLVES